MMESLMQLIAAFGYAGIFAIVLAESGLFFAFFLPGNSFLFTAGFLASQGALDIAILAPLVFAASVIGGAVGYRSGQGAGRRIFSRPNAGKLERSCLHHAKGFYEEHGNVSIVMARFIYAVRTFTPIVAGMVSMDGKKFMFYNILGALVWGVGLVFAGNLLGQSVPHADRYVMPIVIVIIVASMILALRKGRKKTHE